MNSSPNKANDPGEICWKTKYTYSALTKPKSMNRLQMLMVSPFRKDRNKDGGGKIACIKGELIIKKILEYENVNIETICIEITISKEIGG